jgi:hypothetical protein
VRRPVDGEQQRKEQGRRGGGLPEGNTSRRGRRDTWPRICFIEGAKRRWSDELARSERPARVRTPPRRPTSARASADRAGADRTRRGTALEGMLVRMGRGWSGRLLACGRGRTSRPPRRPTSVRTAADGRAPRRPRSGRRRQDASKGVHGRDTPCRLGRARRKAPHVGNGGH